MCSHLKILEGHLHQLGISEIFRGQAWSENCNEWVYFDCVLDLKSLRSKFTFQDFIKDFQYFDPKVANESGFICEKCKDGIIGYFKNSDDKIFIS